MPERKGGRKIFHRLVSMEEAKRVLDSIVQRKIGHVELPLREASGMVLSDSVFARVDLPPFDRAEMDGYALNSSATEYATDRKPVTLRVVGSIGAGEVASKEVSGGECMEIATGAPLPKGADSVVMVEYTEARGEKVRIFKATTPGENVASTGSDVQIGEMILREGTKIGPREAGILAASGMDSVKVLRRPRAGILSTGDELAEPGSSLEGGKIFDSNTFALATAVSEAGGLPDILGKVGDSAVEIERLVGEGIERDDILLVSGGTSAGTGDLVYRVLEEYCDAGILVHGLNVKPGKPTIIAAHRGKAVIGLPGYPVSALIIFDQLVRPLLESLAGLPPREGKEVGARLMERVNGARGRRWFLPVHLISGREGMRAYPVMASSGSIGALARADGYIIVREDAEYVGEGEEVLAYPFPGAERKVDLVLMGSHCPGVDLLLQLLFRRGGFTAKALNVGSLAGLRAVSRGECDIAGIHILDERDMTYNLRAVKEAGLPRSSLVRGYRRMQGIMVAPGNPRGVRGIGDALREGITFVNRNRGSGTRILTDGMLKEVAERRRIGFQEAMGRIRGYNWEAKTHSAVAAAVRQGRADMGVGIQSLAESYGLGFIPIKEESYDFLINPASSEKLAVAAFLEALRSEEFRVVIGAFPGYAL